MKYQPVYKCPLCGRLLSRSQPQEVPTEMLPALLGKVIQHQQLAANPFARNNVPMHIPCKCPDGSAGLRSSPASGASNEGARFLDL